MFVAMEIRPATDADRDAIWNIFHEIVAPADAYASGDRCSLTLVAFRGENRLRIGTRNFAHGDPAEPADKCAN